jgi:signal transduction histidine kinase
MMSTYGLKTNIAVNVVLLLFFAMALTAFVTINLIERILVKEQIGKGRMLVTVLEHQGDALLSEKPPDLDRMLEASGVSMAMILIPETGRKAVFGKPCPHDATLESMTRQAAVRRKAVENHTGHGFGVFWTQHQSVLFAEPLHGKSETRAGVGLHIPLSPLYGQIRKAQRLIFIYILINTFLMTWAGVHQIGKVAVKPLHRLLRRAEAFKGETGDFAFEEKSGNEFNKLSMALNNMLGRISIHKNDLERTVKSLEAANAELKKAQANIVRAEKLASVGRLSSGIAHEIGNPLGIVSGYLELLKNKDIPNEQKQDFIVRAEKELERIDRIIKQLLDYARTRPAQFTGISVHDAIRDVADMMKVQPLMAGIRLDVRLGAEPDRIMGDSDHLRQILLNLVINARDAMAAAGRKEGLLSIETTIPEGGEGSSVAGPFIKVRVRDNGVG